jgi:hypothetical protein
MIQSQHAIRELSILRGHEHPCSNIIDIPLPHPRALAKALRKMQDAGIPHFAWADPDHPEWGMTSIATAPLVGEQRAPLANYRLAPVVTTASTAASNADGASSNLAGRANAGAVV